MDGALPTTHAERDTRLHVAAEASDDGPTSPHPGRPPTPDRPRRGPLVRRALIRPTKRAAGAEVLRTAVVAVSVTAVLGIALELALAGHWRTPVQVLPWLAVTATSLANVLLLTATRVGRLGAVRALAGGSALLGVLGVVEHLVANRDVVARLDPQGSAAGQVWEALRGPVPVLAAAVVALPATLTVVATLGHPLAALPPNDWTTQPIPAVTATVEVAR